jgi:hypothetical protein
MGLLLWVQDHWLELLQSVGIVGSLALTAIALRRDTGSRRITNLLELTKQHREIWITLYERPEFNRIMQATTNTREATPEEELFVHSLILHLNAAYHAMKDKLFMPPEGLQKDIQRFFAKPIPKRIWEQTKVLHDRGFVRFVESSIEAQDGQL